MTAEHIRILIVDDDPLVREMLVFLLEANGYLAESAADGAEALARCGSDPQIQLVLSDLNMPGVSGLELTAALHHARASLPVLILTGVSEVASALEAMDRGADGYLVKDENLMEALPFVIQRAWEHHRMKQENARLAAELDRVSAMLRHRGPAAAPLEPERELRASATEHWLEQIRTLCGELAAEDGLTEKQNEQIKRIRTAADTLVTLLSSTAVPDL